MMMMMSQLIWSHLHKSTQAILRLGVVMTTEETLTSPDSPLAPPPHARILRLAVRESRHSRLIFIATYVYRRKTKIRHTQHVPVLLGAPRRGQLHLRRLHHPLLSAAISGGRRLAAARPQRERGRRGGATGGGARRLRRPSWPVPRPRGLGRVRRRPPPRLVLQRLRHGRVGPGAQAHHPVRVLVSYAMLLYKPYLTDLSFHIFVWTASCTRGRRAWSEFALGIKSLRRASGARYVGIVYMPYKPG